jgi:hypothetical protein
VLHDYNPFHLGRRPWLLKGVPPFAEFLYSRYPGIEALPATPLLTDPITSCRRRSDFAAFGGNRFCLPAA